MKKILIILTPILLVLTSIIVFAVFNFIKKDDINATTGYIKINEEETKLISYEDSNNTKYRTDMLYKFDNFTFNTDISYVLSEDVVFKSGKTYYTNSDSTYNKYTGWTVGTPINYTLTTDTTYQSDKTYYERTTYADGTNTFTELSSNEYTIGGSIPSGLNLYEYNNLSLYEQTLTNVSVKNIGEALKRNGSNIEKLTYTLSDDKTKITVDTYTLELTFSTKGISNVTIYNSSNEIDDSLNVSYNSDSSGFIITEKNSTSYTTLSSNVVTCSATSEKSSEDNMYLNQLGYKLDFTCDIACYVRIHIMDAWIGTKVYATANKETYNLKGLTQNTSPFDNMNDEWYYNSSENTLYLKTLITPSKNEDGSYSNHTYIFNVNEAYFYNLESEVATYKEYIDVQVSFNVDIVQANRVYALWGVDPTKLG